MRGLILLCCAACGSDATPPPDSQPPATVTFELQGSPSGSVVAFQDGDTAWQVAEVGSPGVYELPIQSSTYGVAYGCLGPVNSFGGPDRWVSLYYFTVAEKPSFSTSVLCAPPALTNQLTNVVTDCLSSTWAATAGASGYVWTARESAGLGCQGTEEGCSAMWSAFISAAAAGDAPSYAKPPVDGLADWSPLFGINCGATVDVSAVL